MKKLITVSLFGTAFAAQAEETAEHMPEFWMPVQEHVVNNDIPQLLGYASDPALIKTYNPDAVSAGYLSFLHSAEVTANFIFASVVLTAEHGSLTAFPAGSSAAGVRLTWRCTGLPPCPAFS